MTFPINGSSPLNPLSMLSQLYAQPAAGELLQKGMGGDLVKQLQTALNDAGAKPALVPDGMFGPMTEQALQALTGESTIDPAMLGDLGSLLKTPGTQLPGIAGPVDGFDPEVLPPMGDRELNPLGEPLAIDPTQPPPAGSIADRTVQVANSENDLVNPMKRGDDGNYKGWQHLQNVYEKTTGWRPTDAEIKASSNPRGSSWCGIWACHALQEAGCDVKWDMTKGGMVGNVDHVLGPKFTNPATYKAERQAFENSIKPGDVITLKGPQNHHAIVTKVNDDGTVECMDGNKPHIGPSTRKLEDVQTYYRPRE
ncbi:MAG: peptidoglycan-binding protein [Myxococcaceae bacterium]|nr:peptidoglycan-binding protein [Myxococcaceae bacterium]